ncbi:MAG: PEP-CTERM sorting domain-containing protein [Aquabacterium sp.]
MMSFKQVLLSAVLLTSTFLAAQATTVSLNADGQWQAFGVDSFASLSGGKEWIDNANTNDAGYGSPLSFTFTIAEGFQGTLTIVDANMAGDTFKVFNNGGLLGETSNVAVQQYGSAPDVGDDYDAAMASSHFSRGVFTLGSGTYGISGELSQSLMVGGEPLNATGGGVKLSVSAVPEPSSAALMLAALGVTFLVSRRRAVR